MVEVSDDLFEEMVKKALASIPPDLVAAMNNVAVFVEEQAESPKVFGRYQGYPLTVRGVRYGGYGKTPLPDRITIYRRPILSRCQTEGEVAEIVHKVVLHEVAHHFGIGEARLNELGWGPKSPPDDLASCATPSPSTL